MKALSVKQPWASYIAFGAKTVEWRSWPTKYRGPLLICSSKGDCILELENSPAKEIILPGGMALGVVDLVECQNMTLADFKAAMITSDKENSAFAPTGYAWHIRPLYEIIPVPVKGKLGIFNIGNINLEKIPSYFLNHATYLDWLRSGKIFRDPNWDLRNKQS